MPDVIDGFTFGTLTERLEVFDTAQPAYTSRKTLSGAVASTATYTAIYTLFVEQTITTPSCTLPTSVAQCQSSWLAYAERRNKDRHLTSYPVCDGVQESCRSSMISWILAESSVAPPICTQASMPHDVCWVFRDAHRLILPEADPGGWQWGLQTLYDDRSTDMTWDTACTPAPLCTLGCARCAITAGSVELLIGQ